ncbi:glycoside hydrolase family 13 protein [Candidatus Riflebacteria bacterium]
MEISTVRDNSMKTMNIHDRKRAVALDKRAKDWRTGAIVYQIFVDRFAPSNRLAEKKEYYKSPRKLRTWNEKPEKGHYLEDARVWSHEVDFWGGDLLSLKARLGYLHELGVDTVYLNPIFESLTNHKYDAWDFMQIDPAYGTRADLQALAKEVHEKGMRLVLDGVFNHMGRGAPHFQKALADKNDPNRYFFRFSEKNDIGYIGWMDVANLPELNLDDPRVEDEIFVKSDSVVQSYLRRENIDGWRLDVAFDIGFEILTRLTNAAHAAKPGSLIIGEIYNYPEEWFPAVDGVMNMHARLLILKMINGEISGKVAACMWENMVVDCSYENLLQSWIVLDNHDTPRLGNILKEEWQQRMARVLQFTLPGSVCLYYGSELGMKGGEDPQQRAPMRWDLVNDANKILAFHRQLIKLRKDSPALIYGDFRTLATEKLFAFLRRTNSVRDTVVVVVNTKDEEITEWLQLRESKFQDVTKLKDVFSAKTFTVQAGLVQLNVPGNGFLVLKIETDDNAIGYRRYDRIF